MTARSKKTERYDWHLLQSLAARVAGLESLLFEVLARSAPDPDNNAGRWFTVATFADEAQARRCFQAVRGAFCPPDFGCADQARLRVDDADPGAEVSWAVEVSVYAAIDALIIAASVEHDARMASRPSPMKLATWSVLDAICPREVTR
jgi:hypothetical protein